MWSLALLITAQALQLDADFSLDFAIRRYTALLSFVCRAPGWCGLALGAGMHNTDQIVVFLQANGSAKVEDAFSLGYNTPVFDADVGGSNDVRIVGISRTEDGRYNVTVERPLRTSDSFDTDIRAEVVTYSYAYSHDIGFEYHYENAGRFTIDLSTAVVKKPKPVAEDWKVHSSLLFNLWVLIVPALIAISRFLRFWRYNTVVHSLGGLAVLMCTVYLILEAYSSAQKGAAGYHARVGMVVASLALAQATSGAASLWSSHQRQSYIPTKLFRTAHFAIAVCMILAVLRNIWYARKPPYGSSLVARTAVIMIPVVLVSGELVCRCRAVTKFCFSGRLLRNSSNPTVNLSAQGKAIALFNQYIIDVGTLGIYHPGGVESIIQNLYDNMGKYLYAVVRPEGSVSLPHSSFAIETAKRMAIAVQDYPDGLFHRVDRGQGYKSQSWRLQRKVEIADSTWLLALTSTGVKCAKSVSVDLMGKYVQVKRSQVRRYYSIALCLRIDNLQQWVSFARTHSVPIVSPEDSLLAENDVEGIDGAVSLVVRAYSPTSVSHWLCSLPLGESLRFKGPFGRGLDLDPSFRGQALAVVGGTGLVPLLDLVQFLWWKEAKAQGFPVVLDTSALDGLHLTLCAAFHREENAFGMFLLRSLQRLCEGQENPRFRLKLWFTQQDDRESRAESIRKEIRALGLAKVWVCGPAGLETSVREIAAREGISPTLLTFL